MFKVIALICHYDEDIVVDQYRKVVLLPFAPFIGLRVCELHVKHKIIYVSYDIEGEAFTVELEEFRDEDVKEYSGGPITMDTYKESFLNKGWVHDT